MVFDRKRASTDRSSCIFSRVHLYRILQQVFPCYQHVILCCICIITTNIPACVRIHAYTLIAIIIYDVRASIISVYDIGTIHICCHIIESRSKSAIFFFSPLGNMPINTIFLVHLYSSLSCSKTHILITVAVYTTFNKNRYGETVNEHDCKHRSNPSVKSSRYVPG